jgi:hypothetical protein
MVCLNGIVARICPLVSLEFLCYRFPITVYQGQSSPWNIGMAYRIPDSNINLSGSYQQGKGNIQISCVPDESLPLLGPNGKHTCCVHHAQRMCPSVPLLCAVPSGVCLVFSAICSY